MEKQEKNRKIEEKVQQQEDAVLKTATQFFADELLGFLGIEGEVTQIAPTELVRLELRKRYLDFNLVMGDGTWKHFEFQSTDEGVAGLKRFRSYEAVASEQYGVEITTYVLYSGNIKRPITELTEGINTYRVYPIIMKNWSAEEYFEKLRKKKEAGLPFTKTDLLPLTLCMLMGGRMPEKDRVKGAFLYTREAKEVGSQERQKIEAMIYAMATKFLEEADLEEMKEVVRMTELGRMLMNDGIAEGMEKGMEKGMEQRSLQIARNLIGCISEELIAEKTGLSLEKVRELKKEKENESEREL